MKNKLTIILSVVLSVTLTTAVNLGIPAVKGMKAFDPAATSLGTAFTYQGRLEKVGQPVTGVTCSFQFGLYDVDTGGSPLGSGILTTDLELINGLFTTSLDFGAAFNGEMRWLEIAAQCPDDVIYTTIGRQPLTAAPYALYAKAIPLEGSGSAETAARSDHDHWGEIWTGTGGGLSLDGGTAGVYASGSSYGVKANSSAWDVMLGGNIGALASLDTTESTMRLISNNDIRLGLDNDNNSTSSFKIYNGQSEEAFSVDETGKVQWKTQKGYLSITPSVFRPYENYNYRLDGASLYTGLAYDFFANVNLPNGVIITKITHYWYDESGIYDLQLRLFRSTISATTIEMAYMESTDFPGAGSSIDSDIYLPIIDNSQYGYYFLLSFSGGSEHVKSYSIIVEYEYSRPY